MDILDDMGVSELSTIFLKVNYSFKKVFVTRSPECCLCLCVLCRYSALLPVLQSESSQSVPAGKPFNSSLELLTQAINGAHRFI